MVYFKPLKENRCQPRLPYPRKLYFKFEGKTKIVQEKLKQFTITKPLLKRKLNEVLHKEEEDKHNHESAGQYKSHGKIRKANENKERIKH
jgi:hypothetical protein